MANQGTGSQRDSERDDSSMGSQNNRGSQDTSGEMGSTNMGRTDSDWQ